MSENTKKIIVQALKDLACEVAKVIGKKVVDVSSEVQDRYHKQGNAIPPQSVSDQGK